MAKIKVREATGTVLDLLVSRAGANGGNDGWGWFEIDDEGFLFDPLNECRYSPSTDPKIAYPIIEREITGADLLSNWKGKNRWIARKFEYLPNDKNRMIESEGQTLLIAAMRCYVISKLGEEVEVPDELWFKD